MMSSDRSPRRLKTYSLNLLRQIPQLRLFSDEQLFEMEVVGHVFPFKTNNFVTEELIRWDNAPDDPIFRLNFPQKGMLSPEHFEKMASSLLKNESTEAVQRTADEIRRELNPYPDAQLSNIPRLHGMPVPGMQHKYKTTLLLFPKRGQTCHAHCTFCFRWPQFVKMDGPKFSLKDTAPLIPYLREHPEITDVLITGGDPMCMPTTELGLYIRTLLDADLPHLKVIRIGTKALSYWPYRFLTDHDAEPLLRLFEEVGSSGKLLAVMAHFNHPRELSHESVQEAIWKVRRTGAEIRTQSPILSHINDRPEIWKELWLRQVELGCSPYYMFVARDTGAQHYFGVPLSRALEIYQKSCADLGGLARTARGPVMSATAGKIQVSGTVEIAGRKRFVLQFLQAREPERGMSTFLAEYDEEAMWMDDLILTSETEPMRHASSPATGVEPRSRNNG